MKIHQGVSYDKNVVKNLFIERKHDDDSNDL